MDREKIINKFVDKLKSELLKQEETFRAIEKDRIESPGFMQSASDITRSQKEKEGEHCLKRMTEVNEAIEYFNFLRTKEETDKIKVGDILETKNAKTGEAVYYFLVEKMGGVVLTDPRAISVSADTPVSKSFLGKKKGDITEGKIKILSVL